MRKAQEDVNRIITDYIENEELNILDLIDNPPHIIYKVEKLDD